MSNCPNLTNSSTASDMSLPEAYTAFTMSFLTVLGNGLVVVAIAKDPFRELRTIPNYLILNLAVCDLIVGIPCELLLGLLHYFALQEYKHFHLAVYTLVYFSMVASALTILTLAFERYIVVAAPLHSKDYLIYSHLKLAIAYIWLIAATVALLSLLNNGNTTEFRLIVTDAIGIPTMIFMILLYQRIFYLVRRCIRQDFEESTGSHVSLVRNVPQLFVGIDRREREVAVSVFLFVGVFFLCWAPCFVMENILFFGYVNKSNNIRDELKRVIDWARFLGLLNSMLNPVIYALRYDKFRNAVKAILCSSCYPTYVSPRW